MRRCRFPVYCQAARANALSQAQGFGDLLNFQVADALAQPFESGSFDLVWSMESGEHMPDKRWGGRGDGRWAVGARGIEIYDGLAVQSRDGVSHNTHEVGLYD